MGMATTIINEGEGMTSKKRKEMGAALKSLLDCYKDCVECLDKTDIKRRFDSRHDLLMFLLWAYEVDGKSFSMAMLEATNSDMEEMHEVTAAQEENEGAKNVRSRQ